MGKEFYSNGKLLFTGEYAVLDGAVALAVPTKRGQSLSVKESDSSQLQWKSIDEKGRTWFQCIFDLASPQPTFKNQNPSLYYFDSARHRPQEGQAISEKLAKILQEAKKLNPDFLGNGKGYEVETRLFFPRDWGLGSSSTLINNIAQWAQVDAYELLWNAFSGSGYDIACGRHNRPILYRLKKKMQPPEQGTKAPWPSVRVKEVDFNPWFQDKLYFIHLNKKQNSREGIATYRKMDFDKSQLVQQISQITRQTVSCKCLSEFEALMTEHETLLSRILERPTVKESLFPDFNGAIKSLGAWGGDFILATGDGETPSYFEKLGYGTVLRYSEMVLQPGS